MVGFFLIDMVLGGVNFLVATFTPLGNFICGEIASPLDILLLIHSTLIRQWPHITNTVWGV